MNIVYRAEIYAARAHELVNHFYDNHPYRYHLKMAADVGEKFIHLIPTRERDHVRAGIWVHDLIEDARETYSDVKKKLGEIAAEYAYACTNEKGRVRADKTNEKYYNGLKKYRHAVFIKLCDRFANIEYSKKRESSMFKKYKKEFPHFKESLYDGRYQKLWDELENLINS